MMKQTFLQRILLGIVVLSSYAPDTWAQWQTRISSDSARTPETTPVFAGTASNDYLSVLAAQFRRFRNFRGSYSQSVTNYSWVVPAGVTRVMLEVWGGGGGGNGSGGGGGGGYGMAIVDVQPGTTLEIAVGWGGRPQTSTSSASPGGSTVIAWLEGASTKSLTGFGGLNAGSDPGRGGSYQANGLQAGTHAGFTGGTGQPGFYRAVRRSTSEWPYVFSSGRGGGVYGMPYTGGSGTSLGQTMSNPVTIFFFNDAADGGFPGGGGGGGGTTANPNGSQVAGGPGMALIRW